MGDITPCDSRDVSTVVAQFGNMQASTCADVARNSHLRSQVMEGGTNEQGCP